MIRLVPLAVVAGLVGLSACSDGEAVVQAPAQDATPVPATETQAQIATTQAALAFGMSRAQLEDADLVARDDTHLGEVETLILDTRGRLTHLVVALNGPGDLKVQVPLGDLSGVQQGEDRNLITDLTPAQLQALPAWVPVSSEAPTSQ